MNAYANGTHEERVRQIADSIFPDIPISISSEVVPEMYEYERTRLDMVSIERQIPQGLFIIDRLILG